MNILKEAMTPLTQGSYNWTNVFDFKMPPFEVAIYVLNSLFGFPTHSYVLWLIVTATERGITSEIFTLNISVCEIMVCLHSVIDVISQTFPGLRDIGSFLSGFVTTGRFFQCLMCVERYLAVVHPVTFLKYKPLRYRVACCTFVWIMISLSCMLNLQLEKPGFFHRFTCLYISQILVFLSIQLLCCVAVLRALKQSGPGERERGREREEENHMKRRAFHLILITTVTLIITYVPGCIIVFLQLLSIRFPPELLQWASHALCWLVLCNLFSISTGFKNYTSVGPISCYKQNRTVKNMWV